MTPRSLYRKLVKAAKRNGEPIIKSGPITFPNNDVPRFLKRLDEFERRSREKGTDIMVKAQAK